MKKVLVFGNSGAGKSTLSKRMAEDEKMSHLDLDTLAFRIDVPTERRNIEESIMEVKFFLEENDCWVIEGGYADIFDKIADYANELIYLDLPALSCQENARNREWEPHKYESKEAQDENLAMLLNWIEDYYSRDDAFSKASHDRFFKLFPGKKIRFTRNQSIRSCNYQ